MKEVVRNEVLKLLDAGIIYPIADSRWVSPVHCVPKKGGMTVVPNENNELIPQRVVVGYRMCIDYRKVNKVTKKDHYPLPFIDQMLERLSKKTHFCFLDGYSGFSQIAVRKIIILYRLSTLHSINLWSCLLSLVFAWGQARSKLGGVDTSILHHYFVS
jgi:hypothetical protein